MLESFAYCKGRSISYMRTWHNTRPIVLGPRKSSSEHHNRSTYRLEGTFVTSGPTTIFRLVGLISCFCGLPSPFWGGRSPFWEVRKKQKQSILLTRGPFCAGRRPFWHRPRGNPGIGSSLTGRARGSSWFSETQYSVAGTVCAPDAKARPGPL